MITKIRIVDTASITESPFPIYHLSQIPSPIFHPLWSRNYWLLRLIKSLNPWSIYNLSQTLRPIYHPMSLRNFWSLRLILSPLPNLSSITNPHPNFPPSFIIEFLIVETDYITLALSPIYHKLPSQSSIPCDPKISGFWDWFLAWKYGRRRITSILIAMFLVWSTHICQVQVLERIRTIHLNMKCIQNLHRICLLMKGGMRRWHNPRWRTS